MARRRPVVSLSVYSVDECWHSFNFCPAFQLFTEPLRDSDRRLVFGMYHADYMVPAHLVESVLQQESSALGGESFSLKLRCDRPADFETWPPFRIRKSDSSHKLA